MSMICKIKTIHSRISSQNQQTDSLALETNLPSKGTPGKSSVQQNASQAAKHDRNLHSAEEASSGYVAQQPSSSLLCQILPVKICFRPSWSSAVQCSQAIFTSSGLSTFWTGVVTASFRCVFSSEGFVSPSKTASLQQHITLSLTGFLLQCTWLSMTL